MKRMLLCLALLSVTALVFGQEVPPGPVVAIPDPTIALIAMIFVSAGFIYKLLDGLKNMVPWIKDNPGIMKWLNFSGNLITLGGACFVTGQVHDLFDALKCLTSAVLASLLSAGFYEAKKISDLARAGGASPMLNVKAIAEVENGEPGKSIDIKKGGK